jgi:hypothetical protein
MFSHPFIVGMSSKALLKMVADAVQSSLLIVFHMDCTFKCNGNEFLLLVLGITDAQQQFHPLSISIISHRNYATYCEVLDHFNGLLDNDFPDIFNQTARFSPHYRMTDCEAAERSLRIFLC